MENKTIFVVDLSNSKNNIYDWACQQCQFLVVNCICNIKNNHALNCKFRRAAEMKFGISCESHGEDVCLICDACDCGGIIKYE